MTRYEKLGYTKDTKFIVTKSREDCTFKSGDIITLIRDDGSLVPCFQNQIGQLGYFPLPECDSPLYKDIKCEVYNPYPNPPHKYKDLIVAWANGAEIEYENYYGEWSTVSSPNWMEYNYKYRIKPFKQELENQKKLKLQEQADKLKEELKKLESQIKEL